MTYTRDEVEEICKRREDAAWGNGLSWGVVAVGALFLIISIGYRQFGEQICR